jgi:ABC-2 type transport system ATP-binding protein
MLKLDNLSVAYSDNQVLENLSLILESGKIHGLIGLNGSGKTTLLNCLYGFVKYQKGTITFNKKPLERKDVAFLETNNFFYANLTGREFLSIFPNPNDRFDLEIWKNLFDLPIDEMVEGYSTGMKKKLALLAVLKLDRPIIVLDEPFNGLDLESNYLVEKIILMLREKGKTILITSHILGILHQICDEIHWLNHKKIFKTYSSDMFNQIDEEVLKDTVSEGELAGLL